MKKTTSKPLQQDLSIFLNKNIAIKKTSARQKEIEIHQSFPDELESRFDREMTNTVIRNLLNNAIKFTNPGGNIIVSAFHENDEIIVSIVETGVGIASEDTDSLFYDGNISRKGTLGDK